MREGFTLVELSIVLVIIGLLIGGILVGQSLINSVKLQKTISEINQIKVSIGVFKQKFKCLPGDCLTATTKGIDTVNGNGNNVIGNVHPCGLENFRAWHQLTKMGALKGNYQSINALACTDLKTPGVHFPKSAYGNDFAYSFDWGNHSWGIPAISLGEALTHTALETDYVDANNGLNNHSVSPADSLAIDQKSDDGMPNTGMTRVRLTGGNAVTCKEGNDTNANRKYNVNAAGTCVMMFLDYGYTY